MTALQECKPASLPMAYGLWRLRSLLAKPFLGDLDRRATGTKVPWYHEALASRERTDPFWVTRDFSSGIARVTAPVQMITGWYDAFAPWQLEDFLELQAAGRPRQLIIGPWTHTAEGLAGAGVRDGLAWLRAHLLDDDRMLDQTTVRLFMTGERAGWRAFERWPPADSVERRLWVTGNGSLGWEPPAPADEGSSHYRYDPADPTPSLGGPVMLTQKPVRDNRDLEARSDVVTFTSAPLAAPVEAIGPVRVELWVRASEPYFDLFARLCDVDAKEASWNVCDALASVAPGRFERSGTDGAWCVRFDLWPIAHRFAARNCIRLQISSGAHPRYVRNPGTGEDPLTARAMRAVDVEVLFGPQHPAAVVLPVVSLGGPAHAHAEETQSAKQSASVVTPIDGGRP
jgi:putative CocE/NonD family hydrolase